MFSLMVDFTAKEQKTIKKRGFVFSFKATISFSPDVRSAIIVGSSVHLIAEGSKEFCFSIVTTRFKIVFFIEKAFLPIGQRSFTSPACVMQPFLAQLNQQISSIPMCKSTKSKSISTQSFS